MFGSLTRTGQVLWNGSFVLADILQYHAPIAIEGSDVLELGAGCCGIPGQVASLLGARNVTFTDIKDELTGLESNITANATLLKGLVSIEELDWSRVRQTRCLPASLRDAHFDLLLCADVVYSNTYKDLALCILLLLERNPHAMVLMSNAMRKHVHIFRRRMTQFCEFTPWVSSNHTETHDVVWIIVLRKEVSLETMWNVFCEDTCPGREGSDS